jgi:hypothetical protein
VQIVYEQRDADLIISIVAFENQTESNRPLGYIASVTTGMPCVSKLGNNESVFEMKSNHFLQASGKDAKVLVDGIVSLMDSQDLESIRKSHAFFKKVLDQQKKLCLCITAGEKNSRSLGSGQNILIHAGSWIGQREI